MTKDFALKNICPHFVVNEWLAIEDDRQTILPIRPPSSARVSISRNGTEIPRDGLFTKASFVTSTSQPFQIQSGLTDEIRFQVNAGSLETITLPAGNMITADQVAEAVNDQTNNLRALASQGFVRFESLSEGPNEVIFLQNGNGHSSIGLPDYRNYKSRIVSPGWRLVRQPNSVDELRRDIVFNQVLPADDDIFEVSYFTRQQDCRRCSGLGVENDIRHDVRGEPEFITGIDLLAQEVEKIVFTVRGSNLFYTWYGTSISDLVGTKIVRGGRVVESQLVSEIGSTLERYRNVKVQQARHQPVGDQEFLLRVRNISVVQDSFDPTIFRISIDVQNRANRVDQLQRTLVVNSVDGFEFVG